MENGNETERFEFESENAPELASSVLSNVATDGVTGIEVELTRGSGSSECSHPEIPNLMGGMHKVARLVMERLWSASKPLKGTEIEERMRADGIDPDEFKSTVSSQLSNLHAMGFVERETTTRGAKPGGWAYEYELTPTGEFAVRSRHM